MFEWVGTLIKNFGEALIPLKRVNTQDLFNAVRNPIKYKTLALDEKQAIVVWIHKGKIKLVGGIEFANTVINPEIGKGWITSDKATNDFGGKRCYICDSRIPHALEVNERDVGAQYRVSKGIRAMLGLPAQWIQLQVDMINLMGMSKWNQGFDEQRGSVLIFLFGAAVGGIFMTVVMLFLTVIVAFKH